MSEEREIRLLLEAASDNDDGWKLLRSEFRRRERAARKAVRSALEDAAKQAYHSGFDDGREVGRIEGLKEAISDTMTEGTVTALELEYDIRARIQELEGEK